MRRGSTIAAVAAATMIAGTASVFVYLRAAPTPLSVDDAIERFRSSRSSGGPATPEPSPPGPEAGERSRASRGTVGRAASTPPPASAPPPPEGADPLPAEGVYVYDTDGWEDVDVVGGQRHDYPERTTVTIRHDGCGLVERWDALEERWDERETCPRRGGGTWLRGFRSYHEFFRHGDMREFVCEEGSVASPASKRPGATFSGRCTSGTTEASYTGEVVGRDVLTVGGERVETLHVHVETEISGEQTGSSVRDVWGDPRTGLVVRERSKIVSHSQQPVFGQTRYREEYENKLTSLEPQR